MKVSRIVPPALGTILSIAVLGSGCGEDPTGPRPDPIIEAGDFDRSLESGGLTRAYRVHVPRGFDSGGRRPLLLAFHGVPSGPREMQAITDFDRLADERGFVVAYPEASVGDWATGCLECGSFSDLRGVDDVEFVRRLIAQLAADLPIDRNRVYAAGFSNGALFVHRLACDASDAVAGFASVGATLLAEDFVPPCRPARPAPIVFVHGTADRSFPPEGRAFGNGPRDPVVLSIRETVDTWAARNRCAPTPSTTPLADVANDGTTVELEAFTGCAGGATVRFYRVVDGGHTWPGSPVTFAKILGVKSLDLDASAVITEFLLPRSISSSRDRPQPARRP